jgi:hypothetical protein
MPNSTSNVMRARIATRSVAGGEYCAQSELHPRSGLGMLKGRPKGLFVHHVCYLAINRAQILDCHRRDGHARNLVRAPLQGASTFVVVPRAEAWLKPWAFDEIQAAHQLMESGKAMGKIVVRV